MSRGPLIACIIVNLTAAGGVRAQPAAVDFETVAVGTKYGTAYGQTPGEAVLTQDGVAMSVEEFFRGAFTGFIKAEVGGDYASFFPTTPLELDNISVLFDFAGVGFDVTSVALEYKEFGGTNNLAVNGHAIYEIDPMTDLPTVVAPGVTSSVENGIITLLGEIDSLRIGGQELAIDNVTAVPEPMSILLLGLGCGALIAGRRVRRAARG